MASVAALGAVHEALVDRLQTVLASWRFDSGAAGERVAVTVYDGVAVQRPDVPYLVVGGSSSEQPYHTLGPTDGAKWGGEVRIPLRLVTQYPMTEGQSYRVLTVIKAAIDGQPLTVAGFASAAVTCDGTQLLVDTVAGTVTRELLTDVDVLVHQS